MRQKSEFLPSVHCRGKNQGGHTCTTIFHILAADLDGNSVMDLTEALFYLKKVGRLTAQDVEETLIKNETPTWFMEMDTNGDGFIEPVELDGDYYEN